MWSSQGLLVGDSLGNHKYTKTRTIAVVIVIAFAVVVVIAIIIIVTAITEEKVNEQET